MHKRGKLLGVGGVNLKKLFAETGVQVCITYIQINLFPGKKCVVSPLILWMFLS